MTSLNPFKAIEELITEHGSAAIQGKHIAFLRDQIAHLKEQFFSLDTEATNLRGLVADLQAKLEAFESKAKDHKVVHAMKWGCLLFDGDKNLYCPACYIDRDKKMPTSRKSAVQRYCSGCKTTIPTG